MKSPRTRSTVGKLLLIVASALVCVLAAEAALRLIMREKRELAGMWSADDELGAAMTPGFQGFAETSEFRYEVRINELGLRDYPLNSSQQAGSRVLMLGDSFVFGVGVDIDQTAGKVLERELNAARGAGTFAVLNAGQPGSSTFHHLHLYRRLAPVVRPSLVILVFFVGDDWFGNSPRRLPGEVRRTPRGWLRAHSVVWRYFDRIVLSRFRKVNPYEIHRVEADDSFLQRMERVLSLLDELKTAANRSGTKLLIVINPRYSQTYDQAWSKARMIYGLSSNEYTVFEPNTHFSSELSKRQLWHIDLLPYFREQGRVQQIHFPIDGHWNPDGHEFVASILAKEILLQDF